MVGSTASFQVGTPMHAVLEFGSEGYELTSFSSGLMIFAEFVDTDVPDPSVRYHFYVMMQTPPCERPHQRLTQLADHGYTVWGGVWSPLVVIISHNDATIS